VEDLRDLLDAEPLRDGDHVLGRHPLCELAKNPVRARAHRDREPPRLEIPVVAQDPRRENEEPRVSDEPLVLEDGRDRVDARALRDDHLAHLEVAGHGGGEQKNPKEDHEPDDPTENERPADPVPAPHVRPPSRRGPSRSSQRCRITAAAAAWAASPADPRRPRGARSSASRLLRLSSTRWTGSPDSRLRALANRSTRRTSGLASSPSRPRGTPTTTAAASISTATAATAAGASRTVDMRRDRSGVASNPVGSLTARPSWRSPKSTPRTRIEGR